MRTLVVEPSRTAAEGLAAGLSGERGIDVDGVALSGREALDVLARPGCRVDVVVTTVNLGRAQILELAHELRERPSAPHLVVAGLTEADELVVRYLRAGVDAYLTEEISIKGLAVVLRLVDREEVLIAPAVAWRVIQTLQRQAGILARSGVDVSRISLLSSREREVLEQMAESRSNRQIANKLFIEVGTVKSHVHSILRKLKVAGRDEARRLLILHRTEAGRPPPHADDSSASSRE